LREPREKAIIRSSRERERKAEKKTMFEGDSLKKRKKKKGVACGFASPKRESRKKTTGGGLLGGDVKKEREPPRDRSPSHAKHQKKRCGKKRIGERKVLSRALGEDAIRGNTSLGGVGNLNGKAKKARQKTL